jgi:hypothetical protein
MTSYSHTFIKCYQLHLAEVHIYSILCYAADKASIHTSVHNNMKFIKHSHTSSNSLAAFQTQLPCARELFFLGIYILNIRDFKKNMFFQSIGNVYKIMVYTLMKLSYYAIMKTLKQSNLTNVNQNHSIYDNLLNTSHPVTGLKWPRGWVEV